MTDRFELDPGADAQHRFIEAAVTLGATSPAGARPESELPRLSARQLQHLLDQGIVREAAPGTFYVYRQGGKTAPQPTVAAAVSAEPTLSRRALMIAFWLIVVLIPLVYLRLSR
jgi:hypothetical protein